MLNSWVSTVHRRERSSSTNVIREQQGNDEHENERPLTLVDNMPPSSGGGGGIFVPKSLDLVDETGVKKYHVSAAEEQNLAQQQEKDLDFRTANVDDNLLLAESNDLDDNDFRRVNVNVIDRR